MHKNTPCSSTMALGVSLTKNVGFSLLNVTLYRSTIGALQYVTFTRPIIAFSIIELSQFHCALTNALTSQKRVLWYLKGIINLRFQFYSSGYLNLECLSDAYWATNIDDRRSIASYCVYLSPNVVFGALRNMLLFHGQALTLNIMLFPWLHQRCYRWGLYLLIRCCVNFYIYRLVWQSKCHCFS